jgi:protein required for attachment to host cells
VAKGHFAHSLVKAMDHLLRSGAFREWVLVAPPQFLGLIRAELTPELKKHLIATVNKDLSHLGARALADGLRDAIRTGANRHGAARGTRGRTGVPRRVVRAPHGL